jgi:hypothetical protein
MLSVEIKVTNDLVGDKNKYEERNTNSSMDKMPQESSGKK